MNALKINVDEKACVGCSLCADVCPTNVFEIKESETVPVVCKERECFGCLSCSEICPATAIKHENVHLSESYYHNPAALELVAKLGSPDRAFYAPNDEDHIQKAITDLGIRLLSVASVLKQTLGQSLPSAGTMAGMTLASQLPHYQSPKSLDETLQLLARTFFPAWVIRPSLSGDELTMTVSTCFVRDVCHKHAVDIGGELCTLFYNYIAGYLSKIGAIRPRLTNAIRNQNECCYKIKVYGSNH